MDSAHRAHSIALTLEYATFLHNTNHPHPISSTPDDVISFFIYKNLTGRGRTTVHTNNCRFYGSGSNPSTQSCGCPSRLAANTIRTYISQLKSGLAITY